jgi:hypothetical protein
MYHEQNHPEVGFGIKRNFDVYRDVDYLSCLRLLLKYKANISQPSINGTLPIFKAIKSKYETLAVFLDYADDKANTLNQLDNKGLSPLCKLAGKPESEDNFKMITLMLKNDATCSMSLPDFHPMYLALQAGNVRAVRALFKFSDAIHCMANYSPPDPFLLALAKCNHD